jgi:hypothetical protein
MMGFWSRGRRKGGTAGPEGVAIRVRPHNRPETRRRETRYSMPRALALALALAVAFYVLAHYSIIEGVWPVHGTGRGAGNVLMRDAYSLAAWLLLLLGCGLRYRGNWAVVALPIILFLITRPTLFQLFTDPVYQATPPTRAEANALKAERSQLTTILRAYEPERQQAVFEGEPPALPSPAEAVRFVAEADVGRERWRRWAPPSAWSSRRSRCCSASSSRAARTRCAGSATTGSGPSCPRSASSSS